MIRYYANQTVTSQLGFSTPVTVHYANGQIRSLTVNGSMPSGSNSGSATFTPPTVPGTTASTASVGLSTVSPKEDALHTYSF